MYFLGLTVSNQAFSDFETFTFMGDKYAGSVPFPPRSSTPLYSAVCPTSWSLWQFNSLLDPWLQVGVANGRFQHIKGYELFWPPFENSSTMLMASLKADVLCDSFFSSSNPFPFRLWWGGLLSCCSLDPLFVSTLFANKTSNNLIMHVPSVLFIWGGGHETVVQYLILKYQIRVLTCLILTCPPPLFVLSFFLPAPWPMGV